MRRLLARRTVVGAALLPMVFGLLVLWSLQDRPDRVNRIPAAVVNLDEPVTRGTGSDQQVIAAGRLLAAGLTTPGGNEENLGWQLTNRADAQRGLHGGDYYAVITIPRGFSRTLSSVSGNDPSRAEISVRSNDASSALVGEASRHVADVAAARLGHRVTRTYLEGIFSRTDEMRLRLGKAADAADTVADGAGRVANGARRVDDGAEQLAGGLGRLAGGAGQLGAGATRLADGAARLASGTGKVADGTSRVAAGAGRLAYGLGTLDRRTDRLPEQTDRLADGAGGVADGTAAYARLVATWKDVCLNDPVVAAAQPRLCAATVRAAGPRGENARDLERGARRVAAGARRLADATPALERAIDTAAGGAARLHGATGRLAGGAARADSGAERLASGLRRLSGGAGEVAGGAETARAGASSLADGSAALAGGSSRLDEGSARLASGLERGARKIPAPDTAAARVVADPVRTTSSALNRTDDGSTALAPAVLAFGLWLGAFATYLVRRALPRSVVGAARPAWRHTWSGWAPGVAVGVVQAVLLLLTTLAFGASYSSMAGVFAVLLVAAGAFAAVNQAFVATLGARRGWITLIAFTALQAVALGGLVPIDTAPGPVQLLHDVLPVPRAAEALAGLTLGGQMGFPVGGVVVVVLWAAAALAVTTAMARRRQQLTVADVRRAVEPAGVR